MRSVLFLLAVLFAATATAAEPTDTAPKQGSTPVLFLGIGASSSNVEVRKIGFGLPGNGWFNSVIDKKLDAWVGEFAKRDLPFRVLLHNPFGTENGEVMDFDQAVEAADNPRLDLVCQTFRPWLESRLKPHLGERGECIVYLGSGRRDADLVALRDKPAAYLARLNASVDVLPDWVSIAFDDVANLEPGDPFADFIAMQSRFRRVYVEPRPAKASALANSGFSVVSDSRLFWRTNPDRFPDASGSIPNSACGEVLRLGVAGTTEYRRDWLQRAVNDGHTVLFSYDDFWALDLTPTRK